MHSGTYACQVNGAIIVSVHLFQVEWKNKKSSLKVTWRLLKKRKIWPSNKARALFSFIPSRIFQQYCYCNITRLHTKNSHIGILYTHRHTNNTHSSTHALRFKGLSSWTFDLLKNEWAGEMRRKAIGEGDKRSVRETGMRAKVLAREMDGGRDRRQRQMIIWGGKKKKKGRDRGCRVQTVGENHSSKIKEDETKPRMKHDILMTVKQKCFHLFISHLPSCYSCFIKDLGNDSHDLRFLCSTILFWAYLPELVFQMVHQTSRNYQILTNCMWVCVFMCWCVSR